MLLTVQDNGVGMQTLHEHNYPDGRGLMIMRERAEAVGGTLTILSTIGKGTRVEASLPFQHKDRRVADNEEDI